MVQPDELHLLSDCRGQGTESSLADTASIAPSGGRLISLLWSSLGYVSLAVWERTPVNTDGPHNPLKHIHFYLMGSQGQGAGGRLLHTHT